VALKMKKQLKILCLANGNAAVKIPKRIVTRGGWGVLKARKSGGKPGESWAICK